MHGLDLTKTIFHMNQISWLLLDYHTFLKLIIYSVAIQMLFRLVIAHLLIQNETEHCREGWWKSSQLKSEKLHLT